MKYSISIPVGAWNEFLPYTLESLRAQSESLSMAFLDASGDERVKALADKYSDMFDYRRHGSDKGQSDAILEGWDNTDGDILGWLNADDSLFPSAMKLASARFSERPSLDVVCGHSTIIDENDRMTGYHFNVAPVSERLLEGCIISQPSCFFRRSTYESVGGLNRDLHYTMDWDLWLRLYSSQAEFDFIDAPMSRVLWASDTKSASFNGRRRDELKALIEKYCPDEHKERTYKGFAFHARADMIWPRQLRERATRFLRRAGQTVYGIRADGKVSEGACLKLLHYQKRAATEIILDFAGDAQSVEFGGSQISTVRHLKRNKVSIEFGEPIQSAQTVDISIKTAPDAVFFRSAQWQFRADPMS